jgi:hypothetical protein
MNDSLSALVAKLQNLLSKNKSPLEFFAVLSEIQKEITDFLIKNFPQLRDEVYPILKYSDVMNYFVNDKPKYPSIVGGAIVRESHQQGQLIMQVFLNKNNDLVCDRQGKAYGRRLVAQKLDKELEQAFGGQNLIIVK